MQSWVHRRDRSKYVEGLIATFCRLFGSKPACPASLAQEEYQLHNGCLHGYSLPLAQPDFE